MATTTVTYKTITTRIYNVEEGELANSRNGDYRLQDLEGYGRHGYVLVSTVTAPTHDGTLIIDTLALTEEY